VPFEYVEQLPRRSSLTVVDDVMATTRSLTIGRLSA
jgi:hypothetical protein